MTLIELLIVVAIISLLAGIAVINYLEAQTRAKVAASQANLRTIGGAIEVYRMDNSSYPHPRPTLPHDPMGILATSSLNGLTTPIAYVSASAFRDHFGTLRSQGGSQPASLQEDDPFRPPEPGFNRDRSLIFIFYPGFSRLVNKPEMNKNAYNVISIGPDSQDSLITYYPFPASLPSSSLNYGINQAIDTVYDPTNGTLSTGDLAWFGGDLPVKQLVGGGP